MRIKQGLLYLIGFAGIALLFVAAAGLPTGSTKELVQSDLVTSIQEADVEEWGQLVPLIPDQFQANASRATVETTLSELGFATNDDEEAAQILLNADMADRALYSGTSVTPGCALLIAVALAFESDILVAADGFSLNRGC